MINLSKLSTVRLVAYLKSVRSKMMYFGRYSGSPEEDKVVEDYSNTVTEIKQELATRGHILRGREGRAIQQKRAQGSDPMPALREFIRELEHGDASDDTFLWAVKKAHELEVVMDRELADEFDVGITVPPRWRSGVAIPHPRMRVHVFRYIIYKTNTKMGRYT